MSKRFYALSMLACAAIGSAGERPPEVEKPVSKKARPALAKDLTGPIAIHADGKPINVDIGHAAPCVADFFGDGTLHLLVGQFGEGKLRIYRNEGTKTEPRFNAFTWFDGKVPTG